MGKLDLQSLSEVFDFYSPNGPMLGLVSIPHSGESVPSEFRPYLTDNQDFWRKDVDYAVHHLVDIKELTQAGVGVLVAKVHRICVDLNRPATSAVFNWAQNTHGETLVTKKPDEIFINMAMAKYHLPYYTMLKALYEHIKEGQHKVSIIDLHSMPSQATAYHLKQNPEQVLARPDFCISDFHQQTCEKEFIDQICQSLAKNYPAVWQNNPYVGGNITQHIHREFKNTNNIQIEINRKIYMDEKNYQLKSDLVAKLKPALTSAMIHLFNDYAVKYKK